jgi:hypothetical protein
LQIDLARFDRTVRSRVALEAEVNVLRRRAPNRPHPQQYGSVLFVRLYRCFPTVLEAAAIVTLETIIRWHRAGFLAYWRWRSRKRVGAKAGCWRQDQAIARLACAKDLADS